MHRKRIICMAIAAIFALSCSCGRKEEMPQVSAEQATIKEEDIIAAGSGNEEGIPDTPSESTGDETIMDPGESEWEGGDALSPDGTPVITEDYQISDCIVLCDIDNLHVDYTLKRVPEEEDAATYAKLLKEARILLDAEADVRPGDVVNIDMYADNDSYTRLGTTVRVGSGMELEDIENSLIGMSKNDEKKITVTYPEDYLYQGLNGKTIEYKIIVNSIARADDPTEVEIGKAMDYLTEETRQINRTGLTSAAKSAFLDNSEIKAYPEKEIRQARYRYEKKYTAGFANLEDFLNAVGMTRAEFKKGEDEYVSQRVKERLILLALQEETGITTISDEYRQYTAVYGVNAEDPDETLFEVIIDSIKDRLDVGE